MLNHNSSWQIDIIITTIINQCFNHKNGNRRFQYVVLGCIETYFVQGHFDAPQKYSDADVV